MDYRVVINNTRMFEVIKKEKEKKRMFERRVAGMNRTTASYRNGVVLLVHALGDSFKSSKLREKLVLS